MAETGTTMSKAREAVDQQQSDDQQYPTQKYDGQPPVQQSSLPYYNPKLGGYSTQPIQQQPQYVQQAAQQQFGQHLPPSYWHSKEFKDRMANRFMIFTRVSLLILMILRLIIWISIYHVYQVDPFKLVLIGVDILLTIFTIVTLKIMNQVMLLISMIIRLLDFLLIWGLVHFAMEWYDTHQEGPGCGLALLLIVYISSLWLIYKTWYTVKFKPITDAHVS